MSSDQSQIEQTKQQIRGLVSEIAQLSKSDLSSEEYYPAFLDRVVQALAAVGGAVWVQNEGQRLEPAYHIQMDDSLRNGESEDAQRHSQMLAQVMNSTKGHLVPPYSGTSEDGGAGNPTEYLLVLAPLIADGRAEGVVEIFQRPDSQPNAQRGYQRFLVNMCELMSEWLKGRKLKQFSDRHSLWAQADHFSRMVHDTLDLREVAYTITNEGRRMIGCDRVTVAIKRGARCKVEAVSGQDTIENRSNVVRYLGELASKVCATGEPLWYTGSTEDLPPQIEKSLDAYVDEAYTKTMSILPIRQPKTADMRTDDSARAESHSEDNASNEIIGALIVEQIETDLPRELIEPRIDLVYEHSARALSNALSHSNLFLMPVWRTLGRLSVVTKARNLPKTLAVAAVLLVALCVLFFVQTDFRLKAEGALQPIERQEVFVEVGGKVTKLLVKDQQEVSKDQPLVELENRDLKMQMEEIIGELSSLQENRVGTLRALSDNREASDKEINEMKSQVRELDVKIASLRRQVAELQRKIDQTTIRSPMDGVVMLSWSVEKSLVGRVVEPGQSLMSVADPSSPWELDLFLPEKRAGYVNQARADIGPDLAVDYYLATNPGKTFEGKVEYVDPVTRLHEEDGHGVRVRVDFDESNHPSPRVGSRVTAKIHCGRRSVGFTWFHEVFEWIQALLF